MSQRTLVPGGALTVFVCLGALAACDNPPTGPGPIDTGPRLELTGPTTIAPGQLGEYRLVAVSTGAATRDVSLEAEWRSSTEAVVAIASPGRAAAQQPGEAVITATYQGRPATVIVFVVPADTFVLKGTVKDKLTDGPVAGARVQVLSGNAVVAETTTGADGRYGLYGVARSAGLRVSKEGYLDHQRPLEIVGHTTGVDVHLRRLGVPDLYTGAYTLTLELGGQCPIPEEAKTRTYTAIIEAVDDRYVVSLNDATFAQGCGTNNLAPGLGCNQFLAQRDGNSLRFTMLDLDWGEGGQVTERLSDGTWLTIVGHASGHFEGSILNASGMAQLFYCPVSQESAWGCGTRFCATEEFRLRFSRRQ
jgi:Carboxypeptidase regulatory-like domain